MPVKPKSQRFSWTFVLSLSMFLAAIVGTFGIFQVIKEITFYQAQSEFEKNVEIIAAGVQSRVKINGDHLKELGRMLKIQNGQALDREDVLVDTAKILVESGDTHSGIQFVAVASNINTDNSQRFDTNEILFSSPALFGKELKKFSFNVPRENKSGSIVAYRLNNTELPDFLSVDKKDADFQPVFFILLSSVPNYTSSTVLSVNNKSNILMEVMRLDLLTSNLSVYNEKLNYIKFYFDDSKTYSEPYISLNFKNIFSSKEIIAGYLKTVKTMNVANESWQIGFISPISPFIHGNENFTFIWILVIGFLVSILLFLTVYSLLSTRDSALELADSMTRKLSLSENKYHSLIEGIPDVVWTIDSANKLCFVSHNIEEATGYSREEMLSQPNLWLDIIYKNDSTIVKHALHSFFSTGKILDIQYRINHRDGGLVWFRNQSLSIYTKDGNKFADGILSDITKEKSIDIAKSEFVSLASHQLRTPLSTINWYSEILLGGDAGKLSTEQKKILQQIYQSNQRLVRLVDALLNISRIEMGSYAIVPEKINLSEMLKEVLKDLSNNIQTKAMQIKAQVQKNLPVLFFDCSLIRIILQNLLSNAIKYTPKKGNVGISMTLVKKEVSISGLNQKIADSILIKVSDNGCGIPDGQKKLIFGKLFRATNVQEKGFDGNGLGLYIVKSVVEEMDGKIWFESTENHGSTFFVVLPLKAVKARRGTKRLV